MVACAQPNYQDTSAAGGVVNQAAACDLKLAVSGLCVELQWEVLPTEQDTGSFFLKFYHENAPDVAVVPAVGTVAVQLWMPSMGHGSSPTKIEKLPTDIYRVYDVFFVMPGEWDIRIQLKDGKNVLDQVIQKFTI